MKKSPLIGFISLIFTAFCLSSCTNISDSDSGSEFMSIQGENSNSASAIQTVTLTGKIGMDGAVPEELMPFCNIQDSSRAAVPSISVDDGCEYFIEAVCGAETLQGTVTVATGTYSISLILGKTYVITAGIKKDGIPALTDTWTHKPTREEAATGLTHDFVLTTAPGAGNISLKMTVPTTVKSVTTECSDSAWTADKIAIDKDGDSETVWKLYTKSSIPSGQYEVTIYFRNESNILLYATTQAVNVFADLDTKIWRDSGSTDELISNGNFTLTQSIIESFARTQIYVGNTGSGNISVDAEGNDMGAGSPYLPFAYMDSAFNLIESANNSQNAYTIWVTGNILKTSTLNTTKAKSISIVGTRLMNDGIPQDSLNGNGSGTVLTINTTVLVKIKKLKITNGDATNGGGLYIDGGANVILESGALVGDETKTVASNSSYANKAENGGGIYIKDGMLTMKRGSKVCRNYAGTGYENGGGGIACVKGTVLLEKNTEVSYNAAEGRGGGIYIGGGDNDVTLTMKGGSISNNEVNAWGGGVYIGKVTGKTVKINMQGGEISYNKSLGTGSFDERSFGAGGVFLEANMTMSGSAKIARNEAKNTAGGIRICTDGYFTMTGGEISDNIAENPTKGCGAVELEAQTYSDHFSIQGSAKIPYGITNADNTITKGIGKNDIGLLGYNNKSHIYIKESLTDTVVMGITITETWDRGISFILKNNYSINLSDYIPFIEFTDTEGDWFSEVTGNNSYLTLNAPIYVASDSNPIYYCSNAGNDENGNGKKSAPYATIQKAFTQLTKSSANYIICIDGKLNPQTIETEGVTPPPQANSITIKGKSGSDKDIISGSGASAFTLSCNKPITIKDLKITGGEGTIYNTATVDPEKKKGGGIYLKTGSTLHISDGAVISGNSANNGGGIYVESGAKLFLHGNVLIGKQGSVENLGSNNCGNYASSKGAAIYNEAGGFVYLGYSTAKNDSDKTPDKKAEIPADADNTYGIFNNYAYGDGCIYNLGKLYVGTCKISKNYAEKGAGIATDDASTLIIDGATISSNGSTNGCPQSGGGIYCCAGQVTIASGTIEDNTAISGGGISCVNGTISMSGGSVTKNTATNSGGGLYLVKSDSDKTAAAYIYGSAIIGQTSSVTATAEAGHYSNSARTGGGIYNDGANVYIGYRNETSKDTSAAAANCGVCYNYTTNGSGGGINNGNGTVKIANGKISYNLATGVGGGINNLGDSNSSLSTFEMTGGHIDYNASSRSSQDIGLGGGIYNNSYTEFEMTGGSISRNQLVDSSYGTKSTFGSGIYSDRIRSFKIGGSAQIPPNTEGTSHADDNSVYFIHNNAAASVNSCINVISELTTDGYVAYLDGNFKDNFYVLKAESGISLENSIQKFKLTGPTGFFINSEGIAKSAQLTSDNLTGSPSTITDFLSSVPPGQSVTFTSEETLNPPLSGGGSITIHGNVTFDTPNITFGSSSATLFKVADGGTLTLKSGIFSEGSSNFSVIEVSDGGTLILEGATIQTSGGISAAGVRMTGGIFTMTSGTIQNCNDGALNVTDGEVNITGGTIQNCNWESAVKLAGGSGTIKNLTITGNNSYNDGAGINISGGEYTFEECSITANSVQKYQNGGGVYISGGTVNLISCTITGNKVTAFTDSTNYGGGLAAMAGTLNWENMNISNNGIIEGSVNNYTCKGKQYYVKAGVKWNGTTLSSDKTQD